MIDKQGKIKYWQEVQDKGGGTSCDCYIIKFKEQITKEGGQAKKENN